MLVVPASHALAKKSAVRLGETVNETYVLPERRHSPAYHDFVLGILNRGGVIPPVFEFAGEMTTLISLIASGVGISVVAESAVKTSTAAMVGCKIPDKIPTCRIGQLYASLKNGQVTASVVLKRLVGFSAKNRFYRVNRDLGRIFKTKFILQYLSEPELRRRIRRGLLKVEQLHALARDVFYGRRGRINARELWEQMNTCSCLNLILACIVYWQACEISRVLSECDPVANGIDLSLLEHVSPIEWDNVVLYGQYILDRKLVRRPRRAKRVVLSV